MDYYIVKTKDSNLYTAYTEQELADTLVMNNSDEFVAVHCKESEEGPMYVLNAPDGIPLGVFPNKTEADKGYNIAKEMYPDRDYKLVGIETK